MAERFKLEILRAIDALFPHRRRELCTLLNIDQRDVAELIEGSHWAERLEQYLENRGIPETEVQAYLTNELGIKLKEEDPPIHVFICCAQSDESTAKILTDVFTSKGHSCTTSNFLEDDENRGRAFKAIAKSNIFLILTSREASRHKSVRTEVIDILEQKSNDPERIVYSVLLEDCDSIQGAESAPRYNEFITNNNTEEASQKLVNQLINRRKNNEISENRESNQDFEEALKIFKKLVVYSESKPPALRVTLT